MEALEARVVLSIADLRIVSYNITASGGTPRSGLDTILQGIGAESVQGHSEPIDVLAMQEVQSQATTSASVVSMLNAIYGAGTYASGSLNGATTGSGTQGIVYNTHTVQLLSEATVGTTNANGQARQTLRYKLHPIGASSSADFYLYNSHYKAGSESSDAARRAVEAQAIRVDADSLGQGTQIIYVGDFNLQNSSEQAFQSLVSAGNGQAFDPVNRVGNWHDNSSFLDILTQAPAVSPPGGLTGGGLDDRFDFQLNTAELTDGAGMDYLSGTYHTFGNNGSVPLNGNINSPSSTALPGLPNRTTILNLLTTVSDHLPVVADYQIPDAQPSVQFASASQSVGEGDSQLTLTVQVSAASGTPITVPYTVGGSATSGVDYSIPASPLVIPAGATSATITINVNQDSLVEGNETVIVSLGTPTGATLGTTTVNTTTIVDDDFAGSFQFHQSGFSIGEAGGFATITVDRVGNSTGSASVQYATANGSATAGADYAAVSGSLSFADGETTKTFNVPISDDNIDETDETVILTLSNPVGASLGSPTTAILTIVDDDTSTIAIGDASLFEGDGGTTSATFTVSLSIPSSQAVTVDYATADATAQAGSDYAATSGTLTFAPGETTKTISVPVFGDTTMEPDETFVVNLSNATNAVVGDAQGVGTILNDDAPRLSVGDISILEGNNGTAVALFVVSISPTSTQAVTVQYATANRTATAPTDYLAASGTLTFAPGESSKTVAVSVKGDTAKEPSESFFLNLSNPSGAILADGQAVGTILNDDVKVSIVNTSVAEGNSGTTNALFTVKLSAAVGFDVSVLWSTTDGTAKAPADYASSSGSLTIPAGATTGTIAVPVVGDTLDEANETFTVQLSSPTNAVISGSGKGTATIQDDDPSPSISIDDVTLAEGDSKTINAVFTVSLSAPSAQTITVHYATADGTATVADADYTAKSGSLSFPAGTTIRTITVPVKGDKKIENDETFTVNLSSPSNVTIADGQGLGTIVNDDGFLRLLARGSGTSVPASTLSAKDLRPIVDEAIRRWRIAGVDPAGLAALRRAKVRVADLPGDALGQTLPGAKTIVLDDDAAGTGWFIDPTPRGDQEFASGNGQSTAGDGVDLLTVVEHELGHVLGLDHDARPADVMDDTLSVGVRRSPQTIHFAGISSRPGLSAAAFWASSGRNVPRQGRS